MDDCAVTVSFPLDLQDGLSDRWSLGLYIEPGQYIDPAGQHPNGSFVFSVEPRFYLINKDHFGLHCNADLGFGALRIDGVESGAKV